MKKRVIDKKNFDYNLILRLGVLGACIINRNSYIIMVEKVSFTYFRAIVIVILINLTTVIKLHSNAEVYSH